MTRYRLHGLTQSYFTRKMTGYLEYKGIPYLLRRFYGVSEAATAAGFPGGVPAMETPDGDDPSPRARVSGARRAA
jgi:hypothetical protein